MCCGQLLATGDVPGISAADPAAHVTLEPSPVSARQARRFVLDHAGPTGNGDTLSLLTSELVTNGVLHARTPLRVGVARSNGTILVTVADGNADAPAPPPVDHDRPSGRGLMLVAGLAQDWGVQRTSDGKTVWFTVASGGEDNA